jgi:hypothetical protein
VNPDKIARPVVGHDRVCETAIDCLVRLEAWQPDWKMTDKVMQDGPEDAIAYAFVVALYLQLRQRDRHQTHLGQTFGEATLLGRRQIALVAWPAHP